ncbi:MAG TPA: acyltransferase [Streptosporangiaceae bacterium]|nr:acyltransferase [Streptosporangiaceae bacterium]
MADNPPKQRLAWLDALRGIAALAVVYDHLSEYLLKNTRTHVYHWLDVGEYGVFVFFLISGYIVPASLERKGSVRTFWVSRVFRLYPLYLLVIVLAIALWLPNMVSLRGAEHDPLSSTLEQLLMMSNVLAGPNVPNVVWSLSYEMIFYLLITALFIGGVHKRSSWYAIGFGVAAVAFGGLLPVQYFSHHLSTPRLVAAVADLVLLIGLLAAVLLRGRPRFLGAALAGLVGLALLAFNGGWIYPWEALTILGLMFTGTALYRAEQGQYPWSRAIGAAVTTIVLGIVAGLWHSHEWGITGPAQLFWERRWFLSLVLAGLTFGGGLLVRHRAMPRVLSWLGLISYSIYLIHPLLIEVFYNKIWHGHHYSDLMQVVMAAVFGIVLVAVSSVTYLLVEKPMQGVGRRVARRLDARYGPDYPPLRTMGDAGGRVSRMPRVPGEHLPVADGGSGAAGGS